MKKKWLWALGIPAFAAGGAALLLTARTTQAADHLDGPRATMDPAADITDVYSFMSPDTTNGVGHLVLVMDVFPHAMASSSFSPKVNYTFEIRQFNSVAPPGLDTTALDVTCSTDATGAMMTCKTSGANNTMMLTKTVGVGTAQTCGATDDICVFAGLKSDPFFFDLTAFKHSVMMNMNEFNPDGGTNFVQGFNVLTIVVEVNATKAFGMGDLAPLAPKPILAVAGKTTRSS